MKPEIEINNIVKLNTRETVNPSEVLMLKADANYTVIYFINGRKKMISRTLGLMESIFAPYNFYRAHQSYLINMNQVTWISHEVDSLLLTNKQEITVARKRKSGLKAFLNNNHN